jgi:hypothetical protein
MYSAVRFKALVLANYWPPEATQWMTAEGTVSFIWAATLGQRQGGQVG